MNYMIFDISPDYINMSLKQRRADVVAFMIRFHVPCVVYPNGKNTVEVWLNYLEACAENGRLRVKLNIPNQQ